MQALPPIAYCRRCTYSCAASSVRSVSAVQVSRADAGGVRQAGFDVRTHVEAVRPGVRWCLQRELEPGDLTRPDIGSGLHGDPVVARPSRRGRTELAVTSKNARPVLARLAGPRAQVGRLAHPARDP